MFFRVSCKFGFLDTYGAGSYCSLFSKYSPRQVPLYGSFLLLEIYGVWCLAITLCGLVALAWSHSIIVVDILSYFPSHHLSFSEMCAEPDP